MILLYVVHISCFYRMHSRAHDCYNTWSSFHSEVKKFVVLILVCEGTVGLHISCFEQSVIVMFQSAVTLVTSKCVPGVFYFY
jgi:hypothetical protein